MKKTKKTGLFYLLPLGICLLTMISCEKETMPDVTTKEITDITPVSAKSGGVVSAKEGEQIISKGLVWNTTGKPTYDSFEGRTEQGEGPGDFSSTLTNLLPDSTYYVRAYAISAEGTGYGKEISFKTLSGENTVMDADGNIYLTVTLGTQQWMAENLRTTKYRDNSNIITGLSDSEWAGNINGIAAYAIYPHQGVEGINSPEEMAQAYGLLYNWFAVMDPRGLCPAGWDVPNPEDYQILINFLFVEYNIQSGDVVDGLGNAQKIARQVNHPWGGEFATYSHPRFDAFDVHFGKDLSGFRFLPGGFRSNADGGYNNLGRYGGIWTPVLDYFGGHAKEVWGNHGAAYYAENYGKQLGLSVRCFRYIDGKKPLMVEDMNFIKDTQIELHGSTPAYPYNLEPMKKQ